MNKLVPLLRQRCLHPEASPLDPRSAWISSFKQLARQGERYSNVPVMGSQLPVIKCVSSDLYLDAQHSGSKETAEQSECEARKHEEGEAGKPSSLGLSLQPPECGIFSHCSL
jgi:hypothetical protein